MTATGAPPAPRRAGAFSSLRSRNYRLYASGQLVSLVGLWMERVAQDWLVLQLSGGDPIALGVATALQFGPVLALSMWAGVLADRLDKRLLLIGLQSGMAVLALVLGLVDLSGIAQLWHVYLLCLAGGVLSAVEAPVRQSFAVEMVGRDQVANAVALNSMTFNAARMIGPAVAGGLIVAVGTGWIFLIRAASFAGVLAGLALMRAAELHRGAPVAKAKGQLAEGLRYLRGRPDLVAVMLVVFLVGVFGLNFHVSLALLASDTFDGDADAYGLLTTTMAVGTLAGAAMAARRSAPGPRLLVGGAAAFGVLELLSGLMPTMLTAALALIPVGAAMMTFTTTANSTVQLAVAPEMRGRVMGVYMTVFMGSAPLSGLLTGWVADRFDARAPLVLGGAVSVLAALLGALVLARANRMGDTSSQSSEVRLT
ncbi:MULTISPECIES: MFS transporter [Actinosynnema]|uniref:MFS transporter n=1 Tax=Actinosynnema TaxID=40566 RepID=UPI0020A2A4B0|nr:MFS transporter [Actinosynnema pretiosum]MCP2095843.1 putative arabinose efflux permease, MFS family [Actinosynnema pretiosum]